MSAWGPNLNAIVTRVGDATLKCQAKTLTIRAPMVWPTLRGCNGATMIATKAIGALKHYTIYSVENGRGSTYFDISTYDIEDTYLPQFKAPVTKTKSLGYMCSYAALTNPELIPDSGEPSHPHSEPLCVTLCTE